MLVVNDRIKNAYNQYTTQRKSKIKIGNNEYFIQNMDLYADAYDEGNIIGNAISKILKFDIETEYVGNLDEFELLDGIWTGEEYEYTNLGTFKLFEEQGADEFFSSVTAYDKLILFNEVFNPNLVEYPITIYELLENICTQAGVILNTEEIANGNQTLDHNLFVEGETLKDILKAICGISGTYAVISEDKLKLILQGTDTITLSKYQLNNPEYKRTTWKINQVVLGMQDIEGEYVQKQDNEDVEINGVHKIVINNNPFAYTQELRQRYIDELFEQIRGFGYVAYLTNWEGMPYVELGDSLVIDGYESLVLRYQIKSPDGLNSLLQAPSIIDSVIDYVDNTTDLENKLRRTEYIVDKANGAIIELTEVTTEFGNQLAENYYTITETNQLIQNAETGVTNTFSEAGGNNIFRNTGLWFEDDKVTEYIYPKSDLYPSYSTYTIASQHYEYWDGYVEKIKNENSLNGSAMLLKKGYLEQKQDVPNGNYTVSFKYQKLNELAVCKVTINNIEYDLTETEETEFVTGKLDEDGNYITQPLEVSNRQIAVRFYSDADNTCQIYDLMVNAGSVKLAYSQNQNETTTDTVNISKGITITSTDTDTILKANADGIRTLNRNNNVLTEFTDTGMLTKKMKVTDEAQICGILIQEVNDQTWFTKL